VQFLELIWKPMIPLKIKICTWQLARGRLPSSDQIHLRNGPSTGNCVMCGQPENVDHIFFTCVLAEFLWSEVRDMFSMNWNPRSWHDWFNIIANANPRVKHFLWSFFAAQSWAIWTTRNKFTIERTFPRQPVDIVFKIVLTLHLWQPLQKHKDLPLFGELGRMTKRLFSSTYSPRSTTAVT
jgi:hypothetical protein